ncbi:hypothetical protein MNC86_22090 [Pantoea agglomerans]|uniref:hypothetical protein n=1 Tax=Enterobacter agglomerans TaxID=549 RepID=UPI001F4DB9DD|nr:hypothetical protein [Pantoea agglomerans]MCH9408668.1 hypothetical protein [Pantoea agglomerans]
MMITAEKLKPALRRAVTFLAYSGAVWFCLTHLNSPVSELGQRLYAALLMAGMFAVFLSMLITGWRAPLLIVPGIIWGTLCFLFMLMMAGQLLDAAVAHPTDALVYLTGLLVFVVIYCTAAQHGGHPAPVMDVAARAFNVRRRIKPSDRDRRAIAAHEAGHALLFARVLDTLPDDFHLCIRDEMDASGSMGYVSGLPVTDALSYRGESEWRMLVCLAGQKGEAFMNGFESLGAAGDMAQWLALAAPYLSNQYRGVYYPAPADQAQLANNKAEIEALKASQSCLLDLFFDQNAAVQNDLAAALLQSGTLSRDEVKPYLARVTFPADFPVIIS